MFAMEFIKEEKTEQKSELQTSSTNDSRISVGDQDVYRQMTSAKGADQSLPVLIIDKGDSVPPKSKEEQYKETEKQRADDYTKRHADGTTLDRTKLTIASLPQDIAVSAKPGQLKIESSDFSKVAEAVPGAYLDQTLRTILSGVKSASVDGSKVTVEGSLKVPVALDPKFPSAELTLKNTSFNIVADNTNPNRINLENINGLSIGLLGIGGDIKRVSLTLKQDDKGNRSVEIEIPKPEQKKSEGNDLLSRFGRGLQGAANSLALPEKSTISLPLDNPETAKVVDRIFDKVKNWTKAPEKNNPADLAAGIVGVDLKSTLGGILDNITSLSKKGDAIEIGRSKTSLHDFGGMPIEISQLVKANIENRGTGLAISKIEGIALNLPIPSEVAKAVGLPQPFKANLKEVSIGDADKDGNRILTVKTDSLLQSVQVKVDKDLKPVAADNKSNIALDLTVQHKETSLPLSITFNPQQLEKPPAEGPDFKISLKGDSNYLGLIESLTGTKLESPVKDMVSNVNSISKHGDRISISREKSSTHDLGGVILEAAKNVQFKVVPDGPSGARITNIEGIHLKLPVQLPQMVKDLGIDPGNHIFTSLKTFNLSSPDAQGRRKLLLETDHLLKQVGVYLGQDMKPALDPKGNWYMYGFVDNPLANQKMPLVLRFDKNNQLSMSTQELMRIGSLAAWQATDNGGLEGAGFGVIAVATEAGAIALDVKDAVVDTAIVVKDAAVDGAVFVKNKVVEGATVAGNAIADGASTVGGWIRSGWNSVFGD